MSSLSVNLDRVKTSSQSHCGHCGKTPTDKKIARLKTCGRCKIQKYCSESCQKSHWHAHKKICQAKQNPSVQPHTTPFPSSLESQSNSSKLKGDTTAKGVRKKNIPSYQKPYGSLSFFGDGPTVAAAEKAFSVIDVLERSRALSEFCGDLVFRLRVDSFAFPFAQQIPSLFVKSYSLARIWYILGKDYIAESIPKRTARQFWVAKTALMLIKTPPRSLENSIIQAFTFSEQFGCPVIERLLFLLLDEGLVSPYLQLVNQIPENMLPTLSGALAATADSLIQLGLMQEALKISDIILDRRSKRELLESLADKFFQEGNISQCAACLNRMNSYMIKTQMYLQELINKNQNTQAIELLSKVPNIPYILDFWLNSLIDLIEKGYRDPLITLLRNSPHSDIIFSKLADQLAKRGRFDDAQVICNNIISSESLASRTYINLAKSVSEIKQIQILKGVLQKAINSCFHR